MQRTITYYKFRINISDLRDQFGERSNAALFRRLGFPKQTYWDGELIKRASAKKFIDALAKALEKPVSFDEIFETVQQVQVLPDHEKATLQIEDIDPHGLYTTAQAADVLHIKQDSVKMRCVRGTLPAEKIGRDWMIRGATLLELA